MRIKYLELFQIAVINTTAASFAAVRRENAEVRGEFVIFLLICFNNPVMIIIKGLPFSTEEILYTREK